MYRNRTQQVNTCIQRNVELDLQNDRLAIIPVVEEDQLTEPEVE